MSYPDDGIDRDEDGSFAVDRHGKCTMCGGAGQMDNCPGMCSHENCDEWECPQCEGEGTEGDIVPSQGARRTLMNSENPT